MCECEHIAPAETRARLIAVSIITTLAISSRYTGDGSAQGHLHRHSSVLPCNRS